MKKLLSIILFVLALHIKISWAENLVLSQEIAFWLNYRYLKLEKETLKVMIENKGFEGARLFFNDLNRWLTFDIREYLHDWNSKVALVSINYRNPSHSADKIAQKILISYQKKLANNKKIMPVIISKNNKTTYRYLIPIYVKKDCLKCHGNKYEIPFSYQTKIKKFYPNDKAINLKEGDIIGALNIEIPIDTIDYLLSVRNYSK
ncbi:Tll0287-like domain-containing protein [Thermodesulfatator indicus]